MSINRSRLIRFAEYASVSASVLGAIAAITTRQLAYAVAPLSLSATLNLRSRREQVQRLEQQLTQTITQVNQRFEQVSQQSQRLEQNLNELTQFTHQQATDTAIADATTEALQTLESGVNHLSDQIQEIRQNLEQQRQDMTTFASLSSVEELAANLEQIEASLANVSTPFEEQLQSLAQTQQQRFNEQQAAQARQFTRLEENLVQLRSSLAEFKQEFDGRIEQFRGIEAVENDINQWIQLFSDEIQGIRQNIDQQSQQMTTFASLSSLEGNLVQLDSRLGELKQEFEGRIEQFQGRIEALEALLPVSFPPEESARNDFSQYIPQLPADIDYDLEINLGIDFGTAFTKVCFRDLGRDRSEIVTFADPIVAPHHLSLDQILIPTKIAILQDGTLLTGLTQTEWQTGNYPIHQAIEFIKMRLAHLDVPSELEWRLEEIPELDDPATVESVCAYYLSQVIKRAQNWIEDHHSDLFNNQTVRWSVNVGVPVEYSDSPALERFQRVLSLAWLLNYTPVETSTLTLASLNQLLVHLKSWMVSNSIDNLDCNTTPEIAASIWSFLSSREAEDGFYTFFDIGDGTLDGASFRFWREREGDLCLDFYSGKVQPLGVTAFAQQAADELNSLPESIRQALTHIPNSTLYQEIESSQTRRNVQKLVGSVIIEGNEKHRSLRGILVPDDLGNHLKIFVGGGGSNTSFFKKTIQSTHRDFQHNHSGIPPYQIRQIPPPKDLSVNGIDPNEFNRFAVAYGLCIPSWEGPEIRLPSHIDANEEVIQVEASSSYPERYEDTKDAV